MPMRSAVTICYYFLCLPPLFFLRPLRQFAIDHIISASHPSSIMASNCREKLRPPRELLVSWLARLYSHRLTTTTGGNLSLMDDDGTVYITPSGGDKAVVPPERVAFRRPGKKQFEGPAPPSMEHPLHTAAYEAHPDCRAVLHAHSLTLVAFSLAAAPKGQKSDVDMRLPDTRCLLGTWQACGKIALAPYALPGSDELAEGCRKALESGASCVILQNHGVVVVGKSLHQAYDRFVSLEYLARSMVHALPLRLTPVPLAPALLEDARHNQEYQTPDTTKKSLDKKRPKVDCQENNGGTHNGKVLTTSNLSLPFPVCEDVRTITGEEKLKRDTLCSFVHRAYNQDLITSSSGSFSVRLPGDDDSDKTLSFLITPTDIDRMSLEPSDLCFVSDGRSKVAGDRHSEKHAKKHNAPDGNETVLWHYPVHPPHSPESVQPSRSARVHATIYRQHPHVQCIMMVQPPFATAYCITGLPFDSDGNPEAHVILHQVKSLPTSAVLDNNGHELAEALFPAKGQCTALVQGYGLVSVGKDPLKTFVQIEVCESMCGVSLTAMGRGPLTLLTKKQVQELDQAFSSSAH